MADVIVPDKQGIPIPLDAQPGIQRDGTFYRSNAFIDGQWVRFLHDWPQKMGGYQSIDIGNDEVVGNMYIVPKSTSNDIYLGRPSTLNYINLSNAGIVTSEIDRTPTSGFTPAVNNLWSFTKLSYIDHSGDNNNYIIAQVAPTRDDIATQDEGPIFIGSTQDNTPLTQITDGSTPTALNVLCSGGVIVLSPIIIAYGNNGLLNWCSPNDPMNWVTGSIRNALFIDSTKVVKGVLYQGSLIFFTLTSIVRVNYTPADSGAGSLSYSTIQDGISILSANSVIVYQNLIFWIGQGQFYLFNGSVQRLQNDMCHDYFYDNLATAYQSKIYGMVNPEYDEIIWFWTMEDRDNPDATPTENNQAIIYNVGKSVWTTTAWPRSCGQPLSTYKFPIMASSALEKTQSGQSVIESYPIWEHEIGFDKVLQDVSYPIHSFVRYPIKDLFSSSPSGASNRLMEVLRIENDFIINETMTVTLYVQMYPNGPIQTIGPVSFDESTLFIDNVLCQGRLISVQFDSNVLGGYYAGGKILQDISPQDFNI